MRQARACRVRAEDSKDSKSPPLPDQLAQQPPPSSIKASVGVDTPDTPPLPDALAKQPPPSSLGGEEESQSGGGLKPGQGTAIVTGVISIVLGLAYIAITVALDSRGELLPPPPEAFMQ